MATFMGGEVMITVCDQLDAQLGNFSKYNHGQSFAVTTVYRSCIHLVNTNVLLDDIWEYLQNEYPRHSVLTVGDMNFPNNVIID